MRELAERARFVLTATMFENEITLTSDLVLPGTSYLERDGTIINLEGRPQRLGRAVTPPVSDELAFFAGLAGRFGLAIDPWPGELPEDQAPLPPRATDGTPVKAPSARQRARTGRGLEIVRYRGLFSGKAVERVPQLQFHRPLAEIELSAADARERDISPGTPCR